MQRAFFGPLLRAAVLLALASSGRAQGGLLGVEQAPAPVTAPATTPASTTPRPAPARPAAPASFAPEGLETDAYIAQYLTGAKQDACEAWSHSYLDRDHEDPPFQNLERRDAEHYLLNKCWVGKSGKAGFLVYLGMLVTTTGYTGVKYLQTAAATTGLVDKPGTPPSGAEFWNGVRGAVDGFWDSVRGAPAGDGISPGSEFVN